MKQKYLLKDFPKNFIPSDYMAWIPNHTGPYYTCMMSDLQHAIMSTYFILHVGFSSCNKTLCFKKHFEFVKLCS